MRSMFLREMQRQVANGFGHEFYVFTEEPERSVAGVAKQAADAARGVAVVNGKTRGLPISLSLLRALADRAYATLCFEQGLVLLGRQVVVVQQLAAPRSGTGALGVRVVPAARTLRLAGLALAPIKRLAVALTSLAEFGNGLHLKALGARLRCDRHTAILVHLLATSATLT